MSNNLKPPSSWKGGEKLWKSLSQDAAQNVIDSIGKAVSNVTGKLQSESLKVEAANVGEKIGGITDQTTKLNDRLLATNETLKDLQKSFGNLVFDSDNAGAISETSQAMEILLGNAKAGTQAYDQLSRSFTSFTRLAMANQRTTGNLTKQSTALSSELSSQAALLANLGLSYGSFTKNLDSAVYSFGLNKKQVESFNFSIKNLANDLKMMPDDVSRNFQLVSKNLAYDLGTIRDQFVKFQKLSLKTGIDVSSLTGSFGQKMDTIQGASQAAASINQLLGRNAFSATELLMMTDADRAEAIRNEIMNDPAIKSDILRGGAAGKFALNSVAEALGMDRDTTRRFILTGDKNSVRDEIGKGVEADVGAVETEKFKQSLVDLQDAMSSAADEILKRFDPTDAALFRARRDREIGLLRPGPRGDGAPAGFFEKAGLMGTFGFIPKGMDIDKVSRTFRKPGVDTESLSRLVKAAQTRQIRVEDAMQIIDGLLGSDEEKVNASAALSTKLQETATSTSMTDALGKLSSGARSALGTLKNKSPFLYRVAVGEILSRREQLMSGNAETIRNLNETLENITAEDAPLSTDNIEFAKASGDPTKLRELFNNRSYETKRFFSGLDVLDDNIFNLGPQEEEGEQLLEQSGTRILPGDGGSASVNTPRRIVPGRQRDIVVQGSKVNVNVYVDGKEIRSTSSVTEGSASAEGALRRAVGMPAIPARKPA